MPDGHAAKPIVAAILAWRYEARHTQGWVRGNTKATKGNGEHEADVVADSAGREDFETLVNGERDGRKLLEWHVAVADSAAMSQLPFLPEIEIGLFRSEQPGRERANRDNVAL